MSNFLSQAYLSYRGLFLWLNWPAYTSNVLILPVLHVVMLSLTGRFAGDLAGADTYVKGMAIYSMIFILLGGILQCFYYDRIFGTISLIFASPSSRLVVYLSRGLLHYPNGLLVVVSALFFAWLLLDLDLSAVTWITLVCSVILIAVSCTSFALLMGTVSVLLRDWFVLMSGATGLFLTLTGVVIPTDSLPPFLREVGQLLPITHGLKAFRESFAGAGLASVDGYLLRELLVGTVYFMLGVSLFYLVEADAKRRGTYETAI